ncbi:MAG: hypothetical protein JOZ19_17110 [Rubrobacter sp.]|nr:hypothetical protein [Rubrobacter sp.]
MRKLMLMAAIAAVAVVMMVITAPTALAQEARAGGIQATAGTMSNPPMASAGGAIAIGCPPEAVAQAGGAIAMASCPPPRKAVLKPRLVPRRTVMPAPRPAGAPPLTPKPAAMLSAAPRPLAKVTTPPPTRLAIKAPAKPVIAKAYRPSKTLHRHHTGHYLHRGHVTAKVTKPPKALPKTGGPTIPSSAVLLPAAGAVLVGSGVLAYALRRRQS